MHYARLGRRLAKRPLHSLSSLLSLPEKKNMTWTGIWPADMAPLYLLLEWAPDGGNNPIRFRWQLHPAIRFKSDSVQVAASSGDQILQLSLANGFISYSGQQLAFPVKALASGNFPGSRIFSGAKNSSIML
jgi:hypothetical protein